MWLDRGSSTNHRTAPAQQTIYIRVICVMCVYRLVHGWGGFGEGNLVISMCVGDEKHANNRETLLCWYRFILSLSLNRSSVYQSASPTTTRIANHVWRNVYPPCYPRARQNALLGAEVSPGERFLAGRSSPIMRFAEHESRRFTLVCTRDVCQFGENPTFFHPPLTPPPLNLILRRLPTRSVVRSCALSFSS